MLPKPLKDLIEILAKLPSIGPRQAIRLGFFILGKKQEFISDFSQKLNNLRSVSICEQCFFVFEQITEPHKTNAGQQGKEKLCAICRDKSRDKTKICVIEKETDLISLEKSKRYNGLYFIIGKLLSALEKDKSIKEELRLLKLENMVKNNNSQEIILALNPTAEGSFTSMLIEREIKPLGLKITRLGRGLPTGSELEFADEETLGASLENRK